MRTTSRPTPLRALARGLASGAVGTGFMTIAQELSARVESSDDTGRQGDAGEPPQDPWAEASMPAQVARRISEGVFRHELPPERIPLMTHVMHWAYGTGWGAVYGLLHGSRGRDSTVRDGMLFGTGVWTMAYVQLVPMGLYELPWKYPPRAIATEILFHLVYGTGVASAHRVLER